VTQANLIKANRWLAKNPGRLRVGQTLEICRAKRLDQTQPRKCGDGGRLIGHEVRKGETLGGIAAHYSVSRKSILRNNKKLQGRANHMIRVGETIRVCTKNRRYTHRSWLADGVQLPEGDGYNVRRPHNAWGTAAAVEGITAAVARYRAVEPDAALVQVGDLSRKDGGPLGSHMSHQEGRDVDIGYVWARDEESDRKTLDVARTWSLLHSFIQEESVKVIFVDYRLQKRLYEYAQSIGVDQAELDRAFQYPRNGDHDAVLYHWRGHTRHFHVRFKSVHDEDDEVDRDVETDVASASS
jgi:LysM repeat protein